MAKDEAYAEFIKKRESQMEETTEMEETVQLDPELVQPEITETVVEKEKIKVSTKSTPKLHKKKQLRKLAASSALVPSDGQRMGMEVE